MNDHDVALRSIEDAFQGVIPSLFATASADGTPNVTYVSVVRYVDDERIALCNQFLGKSQINMTQNPSVAIRVVQPTTGLEYDIDATYLRSEHAGDVFEAMRTQVDAVAAQTGMSDVFRLRSVELLRVDRCRLVEGSTGRPTLELPAADVIGSLEVLTRRLDSCRDLDDLTRTALLLLDGVFGFKHSMLLIADAPTGNLFVIAHHGYEHGVGAEVAIGDGLIGVAAARRRQVLVPHATRAARLNEAATRTPGPARHHIELPGLPDAQSLAVTPLVRHDELIGVLYVDDPEPGRCNGAAGKLLDVIARHLALAIRSLAADTDEPVEPSRVSRVATTPELAGPTVSFHDPDGTVLLDGDYIIKGVAGRLLAAMLDEHQRSGRTRFSNREFRLNRAIGLPAGNDNLDARLLTLRRRLEERGDPFQLERAARGQLDLRVSCAYQLVRSPA